MTYADVLVVIQAALSKRPSGQKVLVSAHEAAEIKILDYIEQLMNSVVLSGCGSSVQAHGPSTARIPLTLSWSSEFPDTDYSFTINGFDGHGNPVEVILLEKNNTDIVIKTLVNATITAIAVPYAT